MVSHHHTPQTCICVRHGLQVCCRRLTSWRTTLSSGVLMACTLFSRSRSAVHSSQSLSVSCMTSMTTTRACNVVRSCQHVQNSVKLSAGQSHRDVWRFHVSASRSDIWSPLPPSETSDCVSAAATPFPVIPVRDVQVRGKADLPERYAMLCGTFWKGVPSGTKGAPSIDLLWVPLKDVLHQDSKCAI